MLGVSKARADLEQRVANTAATVIEIESQIAGALPARQEVVARLAMVQQSFDAVKAEIVRAEIAQRLAAGDRDFLRQQIEVAQLSERLERVTDAVRRRDEAEAVLESSQVDDALVARIEAAGIDVAKAEAAAATGAATITVEALADVDLEIDGKVDALLAGNTRQRMVDGSTEVVVPGLVGMVVNAGAEAQALADRLVEARAAFRSRCEEGGVNDLAEARLAATQRNEAARALVETAKSMQDDLRDLTFDALAQKVANLTARIARYRAERPTEPVVPSSPEAAERVALQADTELRQRREELDRLEKDLSRAREDVQALDLGDASNRARLEQAQIAAEQEQRSLAAARTVISDEAIATQLSDAEATLSVSGAELSEVQGQLAAHDPDSVEELLRNTRAVRARLADELHDNDVRVHELRAKLSLLGEDGVATQLDMAKSELAHLTVAHERLEARAAAAKLLLRDRCPTTERGASPLRRTVPGGHRITRSPGVRLIPAGRPGGRSEHRAPDAGWRHTRVRRTEHWGQGAAGDDQPARLRLHCGHRWGRSRHFRRCARLERSPKTRAHGGGHLQGRSFVSDHRAHLHTGPLRQRGRCRGRATRELIHGSNDRGELTLFHRRRFGNLAGLCYRLPATTSTARLVPSTQRSN